MHSLEQVARRKDSVSVVLHDPFMNQADLLNLWRLVFLVLRVLIALLVLRAFRVLLPGLRLGDGAVVLPVLGPKLFGFSWIEFLIRRGRGLVGHIRATHESIICECALCR